MSFTNDASSTLTAPPNVPVDQSAPGPDQIPMQQASPPSAPAVPSSVNPAQAAADQHHNIFGRAVKALVASAHGMETEYRVNPDTGVTEETTVPGKPSTFFRNLVIGSLIGGAVGSANKGRGGFLGGMTRSGAAAAEATQGRIQQQDQLRRAQAEAQFKNQITARKMSEDEIMHQATVAHINAQITGLHMRQSEMTQGDIDKKNSAARAYQKSLEDAGGKAVKLSIGGNNLDTVPADQFGAAVVKDPTLLHAPDGYARHFVDTTDLSELHYDGGRWVDDSGSPVNMSAKSTVRAYDVPTNSFKTPSQVSGRLINQTRGADIVDPSKTYSVSPEGMSSLYALNLKDANERARTKHQNALADKHADNQKKFGQIEAKKNEALAKAEHNYFLAINGNKDEEKAKAQLAFEKNQAQQEYELSIKNAGGSVAPQAQPKAQPQITPGQSVTLKNGKTVTVKSINKDGTFNY